MFVLLLLFMYAGTNQGVLCRVWDLRQILENVVDVSVKTARVFAFCKKPFFISSSSETNCQFYKFLPFCDLRQSGEAKEPR